MSHNPSLVINDGDTSSSIESPVSVTQGEKAVTTAGVRVNLESNASKSITIKAMNNNTGTIYVGGIGVTLANGFPLLAGDTLDLDISNTDKIWLDASVSGEKIRWISNE